MDEYELYGYSVFETLSARKGCFWQLDAHWERLAAAAEAFDLDPPSREAFIHTLGRCHDREMDEVIRYALVKAGGRWSQNPPGTEIRILTRTWVPRQEPVKLGLEEDRLPAEDAFRCYKTGSRLLYQARFSAARKAGFDDVLFADTRGHLLETAIANILVLSEGEWLTPPLMDGLLPGLYREWLLERELIREAPVYVEQLNEYQAVAVTNATNGLTPVKAIGQLTFHEDPVRALAETIGTRQWLPLAAFLHEERE